MASPPRAVNGAENGTRSRSGSRVAMVGAKNLMASSSARATVQKAPVHVSNIAPKALHCNEMLLRNEPRCWRVRLAGRMGLEDRSLCASARDRLAHCQRLGKETGFLAGGGAPVETVASQASCSRDTISIGSPCRSSLKSTSSDGAASVGCRSPDVMPGVDHGRADSRRGSRRALMMHGRLRLDFWMIFVILNE